MSAEKSAKSSNVAILELPRPTEPRRYEATMGELVAASDSNGRPRPQVRFVGTSGEEQVKVAQSTVSLDSAESGQAVVLMFIDGDPEVPVITGLMGGLIRGLVQPTPALVQAPNQGKRQKKIELDAQELLLTADSEITLRCGKSSLTLKRDGRVVIRGVHLLSRASSVNRIRGGSIQLN